MSALTVYDMNGTESGTVEFPDNLLALKKGAQVLHDAVVAEQAARRAGTASTLSKGRVSGTGAKPWRQKGTGRARAGYKQSPVWRGGGVAFGPHPRDYSVKINRKAVHLAFKRAFSEKVASGAVKIVDSIALDEPKTRQWIALMKALDVQAPVLFVLGTVPGAVRLASRNADRVDVVAADSVSVYQILRYPVVVLDRDGLSAMMKRFEVKRRRVRAEQAASSVVAQDHGSEEEKS